MGHWPALPAATDVRAELAVAGPPGGADGGQPRMSGPVVVETRSGTEEMGAA
jgi:hypothetical protein